MFWRKVVTILSHFAETIVISIALLYLSLIKEMPIKVPMSILPFEHSDKIGHCAMYALLSFTLLLNHKRNHTQSSIAIISTIVFPILYGGAIELLQGLPTIARSCDWIDWMADIIGAIIGFLLAVLWTQKRRARTKS